MPGLPPADNRGGIPGAIEALTRRLRADLAALWGRLEDEEQQLLAAWPSTTRAKRLNDLRIFQARVRALADQADVLAAGSVLAGVQGAFELGATAVALTAERAPVWDGVALDAVTALAGDTYSDVLAATQGVRDSAKVLIRTLARDRAFDRLVTGQPAVAAGRQLARELADQGLTAIVYKDGSRHGLGDYSEMLLRTKSAESFQVGGFTQGRSLGVQWWEIMDGPGCGLTAHNDPELANGMIVPLDIAEAYPLSHPRCRRVTQARPDLDALDAAGAARADRLGPAHTAAEIEAAAAASGRAGRGLDRQVAARRGNGTLATGGLQSAAARRNAAAVRKRAG